MGSVNDFYHKKMNFVVLIALKTSYTSLGSHVESSYMSLGSHVEASRQGLDQKMLALLEI